MHRLRGIFNIYNSGLRKFLLIILIINDSNMTELKQQQKVKLRTARPKTSILEPVNHNCILPDDASEIS